MPNFYVNAPNYQGADWSWLGNLPSEFYQGAQQKQQYDQSRAFQNGLPTDAQGNPDYQAIAQTLAKNGNIQNLPQLGNLALQQRQMAAAQQPDPLLAGMGGAGAPESPGMPSAPQPSTPIPSNPPASAAAALPTTAPNAGTAGGQTVAQMVSSVLPDAAKSGVVAKNLASAVGAQPDAPLTPEQSQKAQTYLNNYLTRTGQTQRVDVGAATASAYPRGLRNDNPGNIEDGKFAQSQPGYAGSDGRFAKFASPEAGVNAAAGLLGRYGKQGINTIEGIVSKWAPSADGNNVGNYAAFVAKQLGVSPNQPLNMADPQVRRQVATAMAQFENGGGPTKAAGSPQGHPIVPQVPLPKGFNDPQQAILALDSEMAKLSANPYAKGEVAALQDWRSRIEKSIAPIPVRGGETLLSPSTGKPIYSAPYANPNNMILQRFLAENPNATPQQIQQFMQSGRSSGRSAIAMYMNRYLEEHPGATADEVKTAAQNYTTQTTAQNRFLSGPQGNTIRSLNVVVSHLQTMQDLGTALKNGNIVAFNKVAQEVAEQTGNPAPTNFDTAKQIVGAEVIKALGVAGAGTQTERQEAADAFNRARSPQQLNAAIEVARKLLIGQLGGLRRQYVAATGRPASSFDEMLEPQTQKFFGTGEPQHAEVTPTAQAQPSGHAGQQIPVGATATNHETGQKLRWDGQKWNPA